MSHRKAPPRRRIVPIVGDSSSESEGDSPSPPKTFRKPSTPPSRRRLGKPGIRNVSQVEVPGPSSQSQNGRQKSQQKSQQKLSGRGRSQQEQEDSSSEEGVAFDFSDARGVKLTEGDMVKTTLYYFLMLQGKLHPVRKCDIIKTAMNKQGTSFREVIVKVADALRETFGINLIGIKNGPEGSFVACHVVDASNFMITSKFRGSVTTQVEPDKPFLKDLSKAALMLILVSTYMSDRFIDEDAIWNLLDTMNFANHLCKKREELRRFLKTEYVDSLYLTKQEIKDTDQVLVRYGWGFRSEQEISKYAVLKFVAGQLSGKRPRDFPTHLSKIQRKDVLEIDAEDERMNRISVEPQSPQSRMPDADDSGSSTSRENSTRDTDAGGMAASGLVGSNQRKFVKPVSEPEASDKQKQNSKTSIPSRTSMPVSDESDESVDDTSSNSTSSDTSSYASD